MSLIVKIGYRIWGAQPQISFKLVIHNPATNIHFYGALTLAFLAYTLQEVWKKILTTATVSLISSFSPISKTNTHMPKSLELTQVSSDEFWNFYQKLLHWSFSLHATSVSLQNVSWCNFLGL